MAHKLKLAVGKTYLSREGKRVRIVEVIGQYPLKDHNGETYRDNGRSFYADRHPTDLVRLAPPLKRKAKKKTVKKGRK